MSTSPARHPIGGGLPEDRPSVGAVWVTVAAVAVGIGVRFARLLSDPSVLACLVPTLATLAWVATGPAKAQSAGVYALGFHWDGHMIDWSRPFWALPWPPEAVFESLRFCPHPTGGLVLPVVVVPREWPDCREAAGYVRSHWQPGDRLLKSGWDQLYLFRGDDRAMLCPWEELWQTNHSSLWTYHCREFHPPVGDVYVAGNVTWRVTDRQKFGKMVVLRLERP